MTKEEVLCLFPEKLRALLKKAAWNPKTLQEIRLRVGKPVILWEDGREYFLSNSGILTKHQELSYRISVQEIRTTLELLSRYSLYAYEEELGQGFLAISGGHRAGVTGQVIMEGEKIKSIRYISSINIRFAHEKKGCADCVMPWLIRENSVYNTLIIAPPGCGKTTLLRDLIRQISNGTRNFSGCTVGVVDERSEIGGCYQGIPQNDIGIRTDLLDGCPKAQGMTMLLRSMTPAVIAVDEIGNGDDAQAIHQILNSGCKLIATVHGSNMEEMYRKPLLKHLLKEQVFERFILLCKDEKNHITGSVYDEKSNCLYQEGDHFLDNQVKEMLWEK